MKHYYIALHRRHCYRPLILNVRENRTRNNIKSAPMQAFPCPPKIPPNPYHFPESSKHYKTLPCVVTWKIRSGIVFSVKPDLVALSLTFISVDGLQVQDVTDDVVLVCDAVSSQHVSGLSGDVQGFAARVSL